MPELTRSGFICVDENGRHVFVPSETVPEGERTIPSVPPSRESLERARLMWEEYHRTHERDDAV